MTQSGAAPAQPFFLSGVAGDLFALYRGGHGRRASEAVLFVPPFAEEMNKSRRMFTLMAQRLGERGYATLLLDLFGTGDSQGDFGDARWDIWLDDLRRAHSWLHRQGTQRVHVIALRLGAILALELMATAPTPGRLVLWQPVTQGNAFLTQFLRLRMAASMMDSAREKESTQDLRNMLTAGNAVEVAGYLLSPELAAAIDARKLLLQSPSSIGTAHWFDLVASAGRALSPASTRLVEEWRSNGVSVQDAAVVGETFWSSIEITVAPALLDATVAAFAD